MTIKALKRPFHMLAPGPNFWQRPPRYQSKDYASPNVFAIRSERALCREVHPQIQ